MGIEEVVEDAVPAVKGIKMGLYCAIGGVLLAMCIGAYFLYKQHIKDVQKIAVSQEQVHEEKQNLVVADTGAKANDAAQTVTTQQKEDLAASAVVVRNTLQKKEATIKQTVKDPVQQTEQISVARMDSVWDTFCNVEPSNDQCKARAAAALPASTASEVQGEGPQK
ncbi:hypothetical protein [Burkholderia phage FLC6]|nr:hypothetical protein [Burkholderia phage FLC6]BDD79377.1 hypothetical protein [Burkholderia phage FLC8]